MVVNAIYRGLTRLQKVYRGSHMIFQGVEPFDFHIIEDGKLVIVGAMSAVSLPDGLYLDCSPDWEYPELNGDVLTITQAYSATLNGDVLEVE
jgi:hypothetical protein